MPLYTYKCEDNHAQDILRSMKEELPKHIKCKECGKRAHRAYGTINTGRMPTRAGIKMKKGDKKK